MARKCAFYIHSVFVHKSGYLQSNPSTHFHFQDYHPFYENCFAAIKEKQKEKKKTFMD